MKVRVAAGAVVVAVGLVGCSGESAPIETPETVGIPGTALPVPGEGATSGPVPSDPTATSAPATGGSAGPLMTADPADSASAVAFVKEYFAAYNLAFRNPPESRLSDYALASCKTCQEFQKRISRMKKEKVHQRTDALAVRAVKSQFDLGLPGVVVDVTELPAVSVDSTGRTVSTSSTSENGSLILFLAGGPGGWKISEIKVYEGSA